MRGLLDFFSLCLAWIMRSIESERRAKQRARETEKNSVPTHTKPVAAVVATASSIAPTPLCIESAVYEIGPRRTISLEEWGSLIAAAQAACFPDYVLTSDDADRITIDPRGDRWRNPGKAVLIVQNPHVAAPVIRVGDKTYPLNALTQLDGSGRALGSQPAAAG
jgi:hypothetical protein